jgi:hypothetical protein
MDYAALIPFTTAVATGLLANGLTAMTRATWIKLFRFGSAEERQAALDLFDTRARTIDYHNEALLNVGDPECDMAAASYEDDTVAALADCLAHHAEKRREPEDHPRDHGACGQQRHQCQGPVHRRWTDRQRLCRKPDDQQLTVSELFIPRCQ